MESEEAKRQFEQMIGFFQQEAKEKAEEIRVRAEEDFNIERDTFVQEEKVKIRKEYERKYQAVETEKKLAASKLSNDSRLKVLKSREKMMRKLKKEAYGELIKMAEREKEYEALLVKLILQCVMKLQEPQVELHCRKMDVAFVKKASIKTAAEYKERTKEEVALHVNESRYLPDPPGPKNKGQSCCGGIVAVAGNGSVRISNTLDDRLTLALETTVPVLRVVLFEEVPRGMDQ